MKKKLLLLIAIMVMILNSMDAQYNWAQKENFTGNESYGSFYFSIGNKGYVGTGLKSYINPKGYKLYDASVDFWEFDPAKEIWTQKADFGGGKRVNGTGFSIFNKGYAGTGCYYSDGPIPTTIYTNDFWEYDPDINVWQQKANFAGDPRANDVSFSIGNYGYLGTGYYRPEMGIPVFYNDFWEYNPTLDLWTKKADVPIDGRVSAVGIAIGNKGYVGTGYHILKNSVNLNDWWEYNSDSDIWFQKANLPSNGRYGAGVFSLGNKIYLAGGFDQDYLSDFWEYNSLTDSWNQKEACPSKPRFLPVTFSINDKGYYGMGTSADSLEYDFWTYMKVCSVTVSIADVYAVNPGGNLNTIYLGYGPSTLTLTANGSGGFLTEGNQYSYVWSTGATTSSIIVSPAIVGTYDYTVTVKDDYGCTATVSKTITVVDVRCGNKLEKVTICKVSPGNTKNKSVKCISKNEVAELLNKGSYLGNCNTNVITATSSGKAIQAAQDIAPVGAALIAIHPNPNNGYFDIYLKNITSTEIRIADQNGRIVYRKLLNGMNKSQTISVSITNLPKGVYVVQAVGKHGVESKKMIVQ